MSCVACKLGRIWECIDRGNCNSSLGSVIADSELSNSTEEIHEGDDGGREVKVHKSDATLKDQQSTGRKRAAVMYPLNPEGDCEWKLKKNCGGGKTPIFGCTDGKQEARHHGPDKNTLNNDKGNVHRICHRCFGGDVRLLTADLNWIPSSDIRVGMELIGFSENLKHGFTVFEKSIVESVAKVIEPSYLMWVDNQEILVSHAHQWVASSPSRHHLKWRTTESLKSGYNLRRLVKPWKFDNSYRAGWFAGFLDGEGSLSGYHLSCAQKNNGAGISDKMWGTFEIYTSNTLHETIRPANLNRQEMTVARVTNLPDILGLLGMVRPSRLLDKVPSFLEGKSPLAIKDNRVPIQDLEFIGEQEVYSIQTSSKTLVAEGYLSHNCHNRWHSRNDEGYVWGAIPNDHSPTVATELEIQMHEVNWIGKKLENVVD